MHAISNSDPNYDHTNYIVHRRYVLLRISLILVSIVGLVFSTLNFQRGLLILAITEVFVFFLSISLLLAIYFRPKYLSLACTISVIISFAFGIIASATGNAHPTIFVWVGLGPLFAFFLLGRRQGFLYSVIFVPLCAVLFIRSHSDLPLVAYLNVIIFILWLTALVMYYETTRSDTEESLVKYIEEKRKKEEALMESEELYTKLLATMPDIVVRMNLNGEILFINDVALRLSGYQAMELIGQNMLSFIAPEDQDKAARNTALMFGKRLGPQEYHLIMKEGSKRLFEVNGDVLRNKDGSPYGLVQVCRDITDRKQAEEKSQNTLNFLQTLINTIPSPVFCKDVYGLYQDCNKDFEDYTGFKKEDIVGKSVYDMYPKDVADKYNEMDLALFRQPGRQIYEHPIIFADGSMHDVIVNKATYLNADGTLAGLVGIMVDITERKLAEDALKQSEERLRVIADNMSDMIRVTDLKGVNLYTSPSHFKGLGYKPEDRIGKLALDVVHPDDAERIINIFSECLAGNRRVAIEYRARHADGHYVWLETVADLLMDAQGNATAVVMSSRDISERKATDAELSRSEEKYRTLIETTQTGFVIIDHDGLVLDANPEYVRLTGHHNLSEIVGRSVIEWTADHDKDKNDEAVRKCFQKGYIRNHEIDYVDFVGNITPIEVNATCMEIDGRTQILTLCRDITERKRVEKDLRLSTEALRESEERLQRAEKMEAMGTLAGGVAHDLNNVLGVVVGYAELLLHNVDKSSPLRPRLENIMKGGVQAAAIVQDLLTMARRGVPSRQVLNLNDMIIDGQQSPEFANLSSHHPSMQLKLDLAPDLLNISGSPVHLVKTLYNLASNAGEAMPNGGILTIKTANQYLDKLIHGYDEIREGDYVVLSVSDTGEGIPAADLKRIFEPFYTKKVMGRSGTGLGLAVVWGTVKDHQGYINVQSEEGKGSIFTIYFPVTREKISPERIALTISEYMGKGETVLVVDDIKGQRDLAAEMLKDLNYNVASVASGEEAVMYLKEHKVDLMVLDMIMDPGMDGFDTYRSVLAIRTQQKAIIVSGFSETYRVNAAQSLGAGAYVRKPYVIEKLGLAVRKELDRL